MAPDAINVHTKSNLMECQGECKRHGECYGEVKAVMVFGWFCPTGMQFNYCQAAREEDERRGFTVEEIDEHDEHGLAACVDNLREDGPRCRVRDTDIQ